MFKNCISLKNLDVSSFDTSQITTMSYMFSNCESLEVLYVTSFNTKSVRKLIGTFSFCSKLKFLNLSSFDTNLVDDMDSLFEGSLNLNLVILSNKFTMDHLKWSNYTNNINECMIIIENGAKLSDKLKDHLKTCSNVIEITIESNEDNVINFINYFSAIYSNNDFQEITVNDIIIYVNSEIQSSNSIKFINAQKDENYTIKIKYPSNFDSNCDGMFKDLNKIKNINFYNFKGCKSTDKMFFGSSLKYVSNICYSISLNLIGVSQYNLKENIEEKFCNCNSNDNDYLLCNKDKNL
jgi:surface protein